MIIIIPGQYQLKSTIGTEKPEIIRIMGADVKHPDNWLTLDKKSIPSYVIENDYVRLDMIPNLEYAKKETPDIFGDFEAIELNEIQTPLQTKQTPENTKTKFEIIKEEFSNENEIKNITILPESHISIILKKINIDILNKKANFSKDEIKKPIINIEIPITLNYEIDKLRATIDLMDLDINEVIDFIVNSTSLNILPLLKQALKYELLNINEKKSIDKNLTSAHIEEQIMDINKKDIPIIISETNEKNEKNSLDFVYSEIKTINNYLNKKNK